jgi:hypothetical protein
MGLDELHHQHLLVAQNGLWNSQGPMVPEHLQRLIFTLQQSPGLRIRLTKVFGAVATAHAKSWALDGGRYRLKTNDLQIELGPEPGAEFRWMHRRDSQKP